MGVLEDFSPFVNSYLAGSKAKRVVTISTGAASIHRPDANSNPGMAGGRLSKNGHLMKNPSEHLRLGSSRPSSQRAAWADRWASRSAKMVPRPPMSSRETAYVSIYVYLYII